MPVSFTTTTLPLILRTLPSSTMASSSLAIPSVSLKTLSFTSSDAFNKGIRGFALKNGNPSRVFMSLSVGSQTQAVFVDDTLFLDYKPTSAFLFPGQGCTTVGMKGGSWPCYSLMSQVYAAVESLGEYTALAFAGALQLRKDGLKLVKLRGEANAGSCLMLAKSAMVSVYMDWTLTKVQQLCDAAKSRSDEADRVQIAKLPNVLCEGSRSSRSQSKVIQSSNDAVSRLEAALAATEIRQPRIPVIPMSMQHSAALIRKKLSFDYCKPLISILPVLTPRWASKGLFCLKIQLVSSKILSTQNYRGPVSWKVFTLLSKVVDWVERSVALSLFLSRWIGLFLDRMYGVTFCGVSL
ncbi:hypothetical protein D5086_018134 [Populus alba]|uniref:Uncharacterized protein n=1 Tax=Populus alba TaxID=43335 RepID=A0ACC4BQD1_POPAL